jgi:hypothetical protein
MNQEQRQSAILGIMSCACLLCLAYTLSAFQVRNVDIPWHLKTGEWIATHLAVPQTDFFSFSRQGMEWIDAIWLFQALAFLAYRLMGEAGLTALTIVLLELALVFLLFAAPGRVQLGLRALVGALFLLAINPRIICRPELLTYLYIAVLFFLLERARKKPLLLALVPILQVIWANSHGLWPIGLGIIGVYGVDAAIERRRGNGPAMEGAWYLPWVLAFAASLLAGLVQPYGLKGFIFPLTLLMEVTSEGMLQKQYIAEYLPIFTDPLVLAQSIPFFILCAAAIIATIFAGKKTRIFLTLLGVFFIYLAVTAMRNIGVASVVLTGILMIHVDMALHKRPGREPPPVLGSWFALLAMAVSFIFCLLSTDQVPRTWDKTGREPGYGFSSSFYPASAVAALKDAGYQGNIINNDRVGGYLIWAGWPEWKVFADGRQELGGEEAFEQKIQVFTQYPAFKSVAREYNVEAVVVDLWDDGLKKFSVDLARTGEWAVIHFDKEQSNMVFLKRGPRWREVIAAKEIKP